MEIVTEVQHRLLAFISTCNNSNYSPTEQEVIAWFENPIPRGAEYTTKAVPPAIDVPTSAINLAQNFYRDQTGTGFKNMMAQITTNLTSPFADMAKPHTIREETRAAENPIEHMVRISWLTRNADYGLKVTPLGRAMLQAAEAEADLIEDLTVMHLGADNPLSYPLLMRALATVESGLLIDPYLRVEQVDHLIQHTRIDRLLLESGSKHHPDRAAIATYLNGRRDSAKVEVRMSNQLHDRLLIEPGGKVSMLGTSMNGVGRKATILMTIPTVAAMPLSENYEALWQHAEQVFPVSEISTEGTDD